MGEERGREGCKFEGPVVLCKKYCFWAHITLANNIVQIFLTKH